MLEIDALTLRIPHFLRADARFIAEGVALAVASSELGFGGVVAEYTVPKVTIPEGTPAAVAVQQIAREVVSALRRLEP